MFFSVGAEAGFLVFFIGLGIGIWLFYFMIHDVLIHQRFKWFKSTKNRYLIGLQSTQSTPQWVRRVVRFWDAICSLQVL
jgi:hypothetical protein